ncbi:12008_t:CDS:2, partial [Racocetra fulgida]
HEENETKPKIRRPDFKTSKAHLKKEIGDILVKHEDKRKPPEEYEEK